MTRRSFLKRTALAMLGAAVLCRLEQAKDLVVKGTQTGRYTMRFRDSLKQPKPLIANPDTIMYFEVDLSQADAWCIAVAESPNVQVNGDAARIFGDIPLPSGEYVARVTDVQQG